MINFINIWVSGLIVSVMIVTLIELLLPNNKNKKYVKTIGGLFIIFTIISPIITKSKVSFGEDGILKYTNYIIENSMTKNEDKVINEFNDDLNDKNIIRVYKQNLISNIKSGIENLNYRVEYIDINVDEKNNYGNILSISLKVNPIELKKIDEDDNIKIEKINLSNINTNNKIEENSSDKNKLTNNDENIIKEYLNQNYRISSKNIYINKETKE